MKKKKRRIRQEKIISLRNNDTQTTQMIQRFLQIFLPHSLEQAAKGMSLYVNGDKTDFMF